MRFNAERALGLCLALRGLLRNRICNLLKVTPHPTLSAGEALVFWVANDLNARGILQPDALQLLIETFAQDILTFGNTLGMALTGHPDLPDDKLPVLKLGVTDTLFGVIDGQDFFLDLTSGEKVSALRAGGRIETRVYDLTSLFLCYYGWYQGETRSAERRGDNHGSSHTPTPESI